MDRKEIRCEGVACPKAEPSGSMEGEEFVGCVYEYQILKKQFSPSNY
jgi:hypothetical protein